MDDARKLLEEAQCWLRGCRDCKSYEWDADQREAAEDTVARIDAFLSAPQTERVSFGSVQIPESPLTHAAPAMIEFDDERGIRRCRNMFQCLANEAELRSRPERAAALREAAGVCRGQFNSEPMMVAAAEKCASAIEALMETR